MLITLRNDLNNSRKQFVSKIFADIAGLSFFLMQRKKSSKVLKNAWIVICRFVIVCPDIHWVKVKTDQSQIGKQIRAMSLLFCNPHQ